MFYHVRVKQKSNNKTEFKLDLKPEQIFKDYVEPYCHSHSIFINGIRIPIGDIKEFKIAKTQEDSSKIIPILNDRADKASLEGILVFINGSHVLDYGEDVTEEFVNKSVKEGKIITAEEQSPKEPLVLRKEDKVFVVHGRNLKLRDSMFEFLRSIGLEPLEWEEARSATGKTNPYVGEILDKAFAIAQTIIVLFSPDDEARLKKEFREKSDPSYEKRLTSQARPNVIYEAGMAMGRQPERTILVEIGNLRQFSDLGGRHLLRLDNSIERRQELIRRLETAKCPLKISDTSWQKIGNFSFSTKGKKAKSVRAKNQKSPLDIFEIFLNKKIEQGQGLLKGKLEDVLTRRTPDGAMDHTQIEQFNKSFSRWTQQVYDGLKNALGERKAGNIFKVFSSEIPPENAIYGGARKALNEDLEFLKKVKDEVGLTDLSDNFIKYPNALRKYE